MGILGESGLAGEINEGLLALTGEPRGRHVGDELVECGESCMIVVA